MLIDLVDDYVLTSDPHNFILSQRKVKEEGKAKGQEYLEIVGFYPTIAGAFQGLTTKKLRASSCKTAEALLREHTEIAERIEAIFKALGEREFEGSKP